MWGAGKSLTKYSLFENNANFMFGLTVNQAKPCGIPYVTKDTGGIL
jgi:hypothetical protein